MSRYKIATKTDTLRYKIAKEVFGEIEDSDGIRDIPSWEIFEKCLEQHKRITELEEQLKNAIVPKFKVGQEVFFKLYDGQEAIGGIIDVQYSTTSGVMYDIQYSDGWESDSDWFEEKDVWSKEEAQAKLEEL